MAKELQIQGARLGASGFVLQGRSIREYFKPRQREVASETPALGQAVPLGGVTPEVLEYFEGARDLGEQLMIAHVLLAGARITWDEHRRILGQLLDLPS